MYRYQERVEEEYLDPDGYWIHLKRGWIIPNDCHGIVEDSKRLARAKVGDAVPCDCKDCKG